MLPVFCLLETASLYFGGTYKITGMPLGEEEAMKIKGKHQDNITELIAELKIVVPPPPTYKEALGFLQVYGGTKQVSSFSLWD